MEGKVQTENQVEIAVLRTKFDNLARVVQNHMDKEEEDRAELMKLLSKLDTKIDEIDKELKKYKSFVGGIVWTITALSAFAVAVYKYFFSS